MLVHKYCFRHSKKKLLPQCKFLFIINPLAHFKHIRMGIDVIDILTSEVMGQYAAWVRNVVLYEF